MVVVVLSLLLIEDYNVCLVGLYSAEDLPPKCRTPFRSLVIQGSEQRCRLPVRVLSSVESSVSKALTRSRARGRTDRRESGRSNVVEDPCVVSLETLGKDGDLG